MNQFFLSGLTINELLAEIREIIKEEISSYPTATVPDADRWEQGVQVAVEETGLKPQTVYQQITKIPHRKLHGKLYFNRVQLRAYIAEEGKQKQ